MWTLMVEGGWPIWFTLLFGVISLGAAARFARSAERKHLPLVIGMSVATVMSICNGIVADLSAVGHSVSQGYEEYTKIPGGIVRVWSQGFAESMSPGLLGFTLLSLTWMIAAVGLNRSATRP